MHSPYIINLASPDARMWKQSLRLYQEEYTRSSLLNAQYLVTHVGSHRGSGDVAGIARYTAFVVLVLLLFVDFVAIEFSASWHLTAVAGLVTVAALWLASIRMMSAITRPPARMLASDLLSRAELERRRRTRHRRDPR